jgi:hypothetical protein
MSAAFLAGAAATDIVPTPEIVDNSQHSLMTVRFDERGSPLQAKALAMTYDEIDMILVAVDIVGFSCMQCDMIRETISKATGVGVGEIIISVSHSHSTPMPEPEGGPGTYLHYVTQKITESAVKAYNARQPARTGHGVTYAVGASFNQRVPLPDGGVKFTRDFREGLSTGRPIDPRLNVVRVDDENGKPITGWVRFAAHPACVILNTPISGEYPGYMTDQLSSDVAGGAPVLFGYGASGDVNCVPMFGTEDDSRNMGLNLAKLVAPVFENIETKVPKRFSIGSTTIEIPIDPPPSIELLDKEIEEVRAFIEALDNDPALEWVLGVNCKKEWSIEQKKSHVAPFVEWAELMKKAIESGREFPPTWPSSVTAIMIDDLGLVFYAGEPFTELGLAIAARSPLTETLLMGLGNGAEGYIGTDEDRRRGGYETYTGARYGKLRQNARPLPYALGAGECMLRGCLDLIDDLLNK